MSNGDYLATQSQIMAMVALVSDMPLTEFIQAGERANALGPFVDPTLWIRGHEGLDKLLILARGLRMFQAAIEACLEKETAQR